MHNIFLSGAVIALDHATKTRLVWRVEHRTAQGCSGSAKVGDVREDGFVCVDVWSPSDCMSGGEVWERSLTIPEANALAMMTLEQEY